ncbi:acetyltransferase [Cytobacillus horneckiae]|uniref:acetyltransferase n=1 Tax=Cytobacillus horneckiae TaxID=549687 RepID=UPI003D9A21F6
MKDKLLIIGAGGHGKVVADVALKTKKWKRIEFLDDRRINLSMGIEVIGKSNDTKKHINDYAIFVGVGNNNTRKKIQKRLEAESATIPTLIHPNSIVGEQVEIASGTVVMAGVIINCCTRIGNGCIINTGATIDHDSLIGDFVHISPGVHIAGTVRVGEESWLGIGSVVSNNINITNNCKIGAGAVVVKDIINTGTYVGIPARSKS